jgi:hypothetical protein
MGLRAGFSANWCTKLQFTLKAMPVVFQVSW